MRDELGLGYRLVRKVPVQSNSERCLVVRQQYALAMLRLLMLGKRILNVDESWLNSSNFVRQAWMPSDTPGTVTDKAIGHRLSLIAALDTDGRVFFSLT